jgi:hypothetical protein
MPSKEERKKVEKIRDENPDHLAGWGMIATGFFRLYFLLIRK